MIILIMAILEVLAGYICAKGLYVVFRKTWLSVLAVLLSLTILFSVCVMHLSIKCNLIIDLLCYIGYLYLGFILYYSIWCIAIFIIYKFIKKDLNCKRFLSYGLFFVFILLAIGYVNAMNPRLKKIVIPANVNAKFCFVSDIHVGSIGTSRIMSNVVKLCEESKPDFIIFGGDSVDIKAIEKYGDEFIQNFSHLSKKYKIYAVIGNHEIYAGIKSCLNLFRKAGITVLLDNFVNFDHLTLVGRLDKTISFRKSLVDIIPYNADNIIVIDHMPENISESVKNNVLLHLSGHTHNGQMFPMNIITNIMYYSTGILHHIKNTYAYITSGVGFWGSPYRIGNIPEIVLIELQKKDNIPSI